MFMIFMETVCHCCIMVAELSVNLGDVSAGKLKNLVFPFFFWFLHFLSDPLNKIGKLIVRHANILHRDLLMAPTGTRTQHAGHTLVYIVESFSTIRALRKTTCHFQ